MARSAVRFCEVDRQIEIAGWPAEIACPTGLRRSQLPEWTGGSAAEAPVPQRGRDHKQVGFVICRNRYD